MAIGIDMGGLEKMKIQAFEDPEFTKSVTGALYEATVNPDRYTKTYKVDYVVPPVIDGAQATPFYQQSPPADLEFEFLFDSTGIFDTYTGKENVFKKKGNAGVQAEIDHFLKVVYQYNGDIHKPNYLKINWGSLDYSCVLSEVSIEYKLFAPNGQPIRATAKAKFKDFVAQQLAAATANQKSPDLTHVRVVEEGDTLPLLTKNIYGDSKYYLEVARVNKLVTFRKLKTGQRIFFPPIQKPG